MKIIEISMMQKDIDAKVKLNKVFEAKAKNNQDKLSVYDATIYQMGKEGHQLKTIDHEFHWELENTCERRDLKESGVFVNDTTYLGQENSAGDCIWDWYKITGIEG